MILLNQIILINQIISYSLGSVNTVPVVISRSEDWHGRSRMSAEGKCIESRASLARLSMRMNWESGQGRRGGPILRRTEGQDGEYDVGEEGQ